MTKRNFVDWFRTFRPSIATFSYYADFPKIFSNVESIKIELNILNSLIGSKNIKQEFESILAKYPNVVKCIPVLLAVRSTQISISDDNGMFVYVFDGMMHDISIYSRFMDKSGLFDLMQNHLISNLVDYVTGVETGLDSNGRKNRGGHLMEKLVELYIRKAGFVKEKNYFKEMYISDIAKKWNIDLSAISNQGKMEKRFDYVVKTEKKIYAIETNFYGSGGSKLNETARSYKTIANEAKTIPDFEFVWFTDGFGWASAKNNLEETFDVLEHIYCIQDMEAGIMKKIFR
ncbi:MAG: type II restriction endonuclease [Fibrobacteraceae bacterium]|nr:type II restriction endonuclease [Fibrobacteraceae bacterium]